MRNSKGAMMDRPTIVCLCGSTRFSEAFREANLRETLAGRIVLSIGCDFKSDKDLELAGRLTAEDKQRLDELHLRKIDLADEVLILNVGGYFGASTAYEIYYAVEHNKAVRFLEDFKTNRERDDVWAKVAQVGMRRDKKFSGGNDD